MIFAPWSQQNIRIQELFTSQSWFLSRDLGVSHLSISPNADCWSQQSFLFAFWWNFYLSICVGTLEFVKVSMIIVVLDFYSAEALEWEPIKGKSKKSINRSKKFRQSISNRLPAFFQQVLFLNQFVIRGPSAIIVELSSRKRLKM